MSLINKMLQELDKRHASHGVGGQPAAQKLAMSLRPMPGGGLVGSDVFWWIMATVMLVLIVWLGWVMWQLTPRPIVTDLAYQHRQRMESAQARSRIDPANEQGAAQTAPATETGPAKGVATPGAPVVADPMATARPEPPAQIDMLKLATAISTPIPERRAAKAPPQVVEVPKTAPAKADSPNANAVTAKAEAAKSDAAKSDAGKTEALKPPVAAAPPAAKAASPARIEDPRPVPAAVPRAPQVVASIDPSRIDKRVTSTPQERAESEYRRAMAFVNQGRVSEGMDGFRSALTIEPAHEASRQTLVSLLMEQRRFDEAFAALLQGLELNPTNNGYAMLVARIMVERKDLEGALRVLQKHAPTAGSNAEYHAFAAALFQRLGRHSDAVEEYQTALRLAPNTGAWWVGLGISQEASDRRKDAATSFRRAQTAGNLSPDLVAYVDQRLRLLR